MARLSGLAALASCGLLFSSPAGAGEVRVTITPGPGADYARQVGIDLPSLTAQLQGELEKAFQVLTPRRYLEGFADAQAFTTQGLGADYASNVRTFIVGAAASGSINTSDDFRPKDTKTQPPIDGTGVNATVMAGANLRGLGAEPVTLYANYFRSGGGIDNFAGTLQTWGVHAQVKLWRPDPNLGYKRPLQWGGIDLTTGIDHTRLDLTLAQRGFRTEVPIASSSVSGAKVVSQSSGQYDLRTSTLSVPIEVTTNLRFLYVLTVYGGLGFDWHAGGSSDLVMKLDSKLTGVVPGAGEAALGTATIEATEHTSPSVGRLRSILGLQVNLWMFRLFTQLNLMPDKGLAGVAVGARVAW